MSHANVVAVIAGVMDAIPKITPDDSYLSYLPLAHILERAAVLVSIGEYAFYFSDQRSRPIADIAPLGHPQHRQKHRCN